MAIAMQHSTIKPISISVAFILAFLLARPTLAADTEVRWKKIREITDILRKPEPGKANKPVRIGFKCASPGFRVGWKTMPVKGKRGTTMKMTLLREIPLGGDRTRNQRIGTLASVRDDSEDTKEIGAKQGTYFIELEGQNIHYTITVEIPLTD